MRDPVYINPQECDGRDDFDQMHVVWNVHPKLLTYPLKLWTISLGNRLTTNFQGICMDISGGAYLCYGTNVGKGKYSSPMEQG